MDSQEAYKRFFSEGVFPWQLSPHEEYEKLWKETQFNYDPDRYWGGFSKAPVDAESYELPSWAIGPFRKYSGNPVFAPSRSGWDSGRFGGGVHNGSVIRQDGQFVYIYRGESPLPRDMVEYKDCGMDYICDIGIAYSDDGVHFVRDVDHSPFFRTGDDARFSFEDVCLVTYEDTYYLFCNRWDWLHMTDPTISGTYLAVSKDLRHWEKKGLVFPEASVIHRNPCVVQNPSNEAVKINDRFVMYLNHGLVAYSDDLLHWESRQVDRLWPGGEGCFAVTDYSEEHADKILLFTGGHHTGHFYAIGEVVFYKDRPEEALAWLPRPILCAEPRYPWEDGLSAEKPHRPVSHYRDTIFFTGMTRYGGKWWMYYGGSEYYTLLATSP